MALLRYYESTRAAINELTRAAGNVINCVDTGEIFYDVTDTVRFITTHIKVYQTLDDLKQYRDSLNGKIDANVVYVVANSKRFYIFNSLSGEFENILTQDDAADYINSWVGTIPAAIVKNNKRYAPMTVANTVYMQDGDTVEHKINQLGLMTSTFENIQVTEVGKTFDIPVPFRDFFNYPHCMIVCIGTTMITPNRYSVRDNKITFLDNIDIGRTINFFFMYNTKPGGNALAIENIDGANINRGTITVDKLNKVSNSYLLNDNSSIATSAGLKGIYDLIAALCNEKNITVRCTASKSGDTTYALHTPQGFTDLIDGDIMSIKFDSDVVHDGKITYNGHEYPIYTNSTTPIKDKEICANDELYFQFNASDNRFYVTNGMAYRMDQFTSNKIVERDGNIFSYEESGFLPGYDTLTVYLNGLKLIKNINYTIDYKAKTITLIGFNAKAGDTIEFVVDRINRTRATRDAASIDFLNMDELKEAANEVQAKLQKQINDLIEDMNKKIKDLQAADQKIRSDFDTTIKDYATKVLVDEKIANHHEVKNIPPKIGYGEDTKLGIYAKINNSNIVDQHYRLFIHETHYVFYRANNKNNQNFTRWYWARLIDGNWNYSNDPFTPTYLTNLDKNAYIDKVYNLGAKYLIFSVVLGGNTFYHLAIADDVTNAASFNKYYDITSIFPTNNVQAAFYDAKSNTISVCGVNSASETSWILKTYKITDLSKTIKTFEIFNMNKFVYPTGFRLLNWYCWNDNNYGGAATYDSKHKLLYYTTSIAIQIINDTTKEVYDNISPTFRPLIVFKFDPLSSETPTKLTTENYNISTTEITSFKVGYEVGVRKGRTLTLYKDGVIISSSSDVTAEQCYEGYVQFYYQTSNTLKYTDLLPWFRTATINPWEVATGVPLLINGKEFFMQSSLIKPMIKQQTNAFYTAKWSSSTVDGKVINTLIPSTVSKSFYDDETDTQRFASMMNYTSYSKVNNTFRHLLYQPNLGKVYSYSFKQLVLQDGSTVNRKLGLVDTGISVPRFNDIKNKNSPYTHRDGAAYNPIDNCIYWIEYKVIPTKPYQKSDFDSTYINMCQYNISTGKTQYVNCVPPYIITSLQNMRNMPYESNGPVHAASSFYFEGTKVVCIVRVWSGGVDRFILIYDTATKTFQFNNKLYNSDINYRHWSNTIGWCQDYGYFYTTMSTDYTVGKLINSKSMSLTDFFMQDFSVYTSNTTNANYNWISKDGASSLTAYVQQTPILLGGYTSTLETTSIQLNANSENYIYLIRDDDTGALRFEIRDEADGIVPNVDGPSDTTSYKSVLVARIVTNDNAVISQDIYPVGNSYLDKVPYTPLDSYPVGSIYMNVNPTDPAKIFGGLWEQLPPGRVLIGQGMSDYGVNFNNGSTGGEYSHTLSQQELPSFNISGNTKTKELVGNVGGWDVQSSMYANGIASLTNKGNWNDEGGDYQSNYHRNIRIDATHSHKVDLSFNSKNSPFKTISPYIVVYIWKRKA